MRASSSVLAPIAFAMASLTACGAEEPTSDAGALDAEARTDGSTLDAATSDASTVDGGARDAGSVASRCREVAASRGWSSCEAGPTRCTLVFEDGSGCSAVCAAVGLECLDAYDDDTGECRALDGNSLGCGDTNHQSDFCECTSTPSDGGVSDAGPGDAGGDAGSAECPTGTPRVWLVGDSTVAPDSGWGNFLEERLTGATVDNRAAGGRSSKSYYDEGRFDAVREGIEPGDYVLIQFGHNDAKPEEYRRTEPGAPPTFEGSYRDYLTRYLDETEAAGGIPILVTSVSRMVFGSDGALRRTHGDYPAAMRRLASDRGVSLLDLEEHSFGVFDGLGREETLRLYAEDGDLTHFPPEKAFRVADMVIALLRSSDSTLRCFVAE